jgi:voltage-gated potassium channel Kch
MSARRWWFRLAPIVFILAWASVGQTADVVVDQPQRVTDVLVLNVDGDLTLAADVKGLANSTIVMVASGDIHVASGVTIVGGDYVLLAAMGNLDVGDDVHISTRHRDVGAGAKLEAGGSLRVGSGLHMTSGIVRLATRPGGGSVTIGPDALLVAGDTAQVAAAGNLTLESSEVRALAIFITSASAGGVVSLPGTTLRAHDDLVLRAQPGAGSVLDLRSVKLKTPRRCHREIAADRVLR